MRFFFYTAMLVCLFYKADAQFVIHYQHNLNQDNYTIESIYQLLYNNDESLYEFKNQQFDGSEGVRFNALTETPYVYKNYRDKSMLLNNAIGGTFFTIKEHTPLQKWTLHNDTKKVKDFTCQKATTIFRGREYTAWYTTDISIMGGPWKFDGLPGLILEVASNDKRLVIEAYKIEKKTEQIVIPNYKKDKVITWKEYTKKYRDFVERKQKKLAASNDGFEYSFKVKTIEDIYED